MTQPDGTSSGVSQAIDAWSFGCVLSVAATWIVLGFEGIRQYEYLRKLSPGSNRDGVLSDRFHDGFDVLPEIVKWHDFLRGHLRPSDTTTELVLSLIESRLLRADPAARYNMVELCGKLQELSDFAEHKIRSLSRHSRGTDPTVRKALLEMKECAMLQRLSEDLPQQPLLPYNRREQACIQVDKEEMVNNRLLGQTAYRRQISERMLEDSTVVTIPHDGDEETCRAHEVVPELQPNTAGLVTGSFILNTHSATQPILTRVKPGVEGIVPTGTKIVRSALVNRRSRGSANPHTSNMSRRRVSIQILDHEHGACTSLEKTSKTEASKSKDSAEATGNEEYVESAKIASPSRRHQSAPKISIIPDTLVQTSATDPGAPVVPEGIFDARVNLKSELESIESIMKLSPIPQVAYVAQPPSEVRLPQVYCATSNRVDPNTDKILVGAEYDEMEDRTQRAETSSASYMGGTAVQPTMRSSASEKTHWRRFIELLKKHARPAVQPGHQRIEWQCVGSSRHRQVSNC